MAGRRWERVLTSSLDQAKEHKMRVFIIRGLVAIAWAVVFAGVSDSLTTGVTVGAGILVVIYPLIDVVASLIDARSERGSARRVLLAGAATSAIAAAALAVAATRTVGDVLAVFGIWAFVSGAAQLITRSAAARSSASSCRCCSPAGSRSSSASPSSSCRPPLIRCSG
jgi:uncharacterized membrane protein HdeD (DUF308 family)